MTDTMTWPTKLPNGTPMILALTSEAHERIHRGEGCPACGAKWVDHTLTHAEGCEYEMLLDTLAERGEG